MNVKNKIWKIKNTLYLKSTQIYMYNFIDMYRLATGQATDM